MSRRRDLGTTTPSPPNNNDIVETQLITNVKERQHQMRQLPFSFRPSNLDDFNQKAVTLLRVVFNFLKSTRLQTDVRHFNALNR